jgi:RNA polymerase sigma factor (sigma-70 family)
MQPKPTVFIVDDDEAMRHSLRWLIESIGLPVETYSSAVKFLESVELDGPGCLILDVRMPGKSGLDLQEELAERATSLPIIILTGHGDVSMAVRSLKAGAYDFIEKPFNDQVLLDRIQEALTESVRIVEDRQEKAEIHAKFEHLTTRERQVLELVVAGKPNKVIARELGIGIKTVEVHRHNVMEKMQAESVADLIRMLFVAQGHA